LLSTAVVPQGELKNVRKDTGVKKTGACEKFLKFWMRRNKIQMQKLRSSPLKTGVKMLTSARAKPNPPLRSLHQSPPTLLSTRTQPRKGTPPCGS